MQHKWRMLAKFGWDKKEKIIFNVCVRNKLIQCGGKAKKKVCNVQSQSLQLINILKAKHFSENNTIIDVDSYEFSGNCQEVF